MSGTQTNPREGLADSTQLGISARLARHIFPENATTGMENYLSIPDVHALVKGAAGQVLPIRAERYTVDRLLMLGQCVDADASFHVPQPNRRIKRSAGKEAEKTYRAWKH